MKSKEALKSWIRNGVFVSGSLAAFVGLWIERPSVALVVMGLLLAGSAAWSASR